MLNFGKYTTLLAFILAFIVILVGAYTRLTDAGLGCPDWPGCYGQILVPQSDNAIQAAQSLYPDMPIELSKAKTEMWHRYLASTLGAFILFIGFLALKSTHKNIKIISFSLIGLVIFQGALGMWTVTLRLLPVVVMGHLLGGFATLSLLWLLYLNYKNQALCTKQHDFWLPTFSVNSNLSLKLLAPVLLIFVIIQLALGGWTSANYAALACPDFPSCLGQYWPTQLNFTQAFNLFSGIGLQFPTLAIDNDARVTIHYMHRIGALIISSLTLLTCYQLWKQKFTYLSVLLLCILGWQLGLGISNVLFMLPIPIAVMHNGVGALLLLVMITINFKIFNSQNIK